jgi:low affinity Fe/Cu permease
MQNLFHKVALRAAQVVGSAWSFAAAILLVAGWAVSGPLFGFSDTWELVINTTTTIITFLMVFLIQYAQNHDSKAVNLKLDELIRAVKEANTALVDLEDMTDEELDALQRKFRELRIQSSAATQDRSDAEGL